jgi:hypothetical protein
MTPAIGLDAIDRLTGGRLGTFDTPCPLCSPFKSNRGQRRLVLRIWRIEAAFAGYFCARCGEKGAAFDRNSPPPDPIKLARARVEAALRDRAYKAKRLNLARWLWKQRRRLTCSTAEIYLREARRINLDRWPATLGFLAAGGGYPPAMIAAFGMAHEIEPGVIAIADAAVRGVHLTRLLPDGSGKATFEDPEEPAKIMIGHSAGWPIVLAPPNDLLGMLPTEGIEDGLTCHQATGLGAWAAGAASRLPALADRIPDWINCVTVPTDDDPDGRRYAGELVHRIEARGIEAIPMILGRRYRGAAI